MAQARAAARSWPALVAWVVNLVVAQADFPERTWAPVRFQEFWAESGFRCCPRYVLSRRTTLGPDSYAYRLPITNAAVCASRSWESGTALPPRNPKVFVAGKMWEAWQKVLN
ncbi:hypothetical protein QBC34DRAFT_427048 [Podospora aff. communis PSN243]|uniref:Uncharacterized protein n=1 Tax=Podospora aff. communis PSN243 TaxID=3040156 RepID=A0AAV9GG99_9PEZI|nr:hypothetical protein QBC34DRAFT_427048 [Podospora aff. communis PSN243]